MGERIIYETNVAYVREMLNNACMTYLGQDISKIVKIKCGGNIYVYKGVRYAMRKCKDVCDLYEALFNVRPIAVKFADDKHVFYDANYAQEVKQKTIELCKQILSEV